MQQPQFRELFASRPEKTSEWRRPADPLRTPAWPWATRGEGSASNRKHVHTQGFCQLGSWNFPSVSRKMCWVTFQGRAFENWDFRTATPPAQHITYRLNYRFPSALKWNQLEQRCWDANSLVFQGKSARFTLLFCNLSGILFLLISGSKWDDIPGFNCTDLTQTSSSHLAMSCSSCLSESSFGTRVTVFSVSQTQGVF